MVKQKIYTKMSLNGTEYVPKRDIIGILHLTFG